MRSTHKCKEEILQVAAPAFVAAEPQKSGGSPRIHSGGGALQRSGKSRLKSMRFSTGRRASRGNVLAGSWVCVFFFGCYYECLGAFD